MPDAFTLRMFVPDGDPEGVRLIDRMNWTGLGVVFPRSKWPEVKNRKEFGRTGVYILTGYSEGNDELPTVYVGQADGVKGRIDIPRPVERLLGYGDRIRVEQRWA